MKTQLDMVPLAKLVPNPYNPRRHFDDAAMKELENSIQTSGLICPLTVRPKDQKYEVIAGIRRLKALQRIGQKQVPCYIVDVSDEEAQILAVTENLARESLTVIEQARAYATYFGLLEEFETLWTDRPIQKEISIWNISKLSLPGMHSPFAGRLVPYSQKIGVSKDTIADRINLLWLPPNVQARIDAKTLSLEVGDILAKLARDGFKEGIDSSELINRLAETYSEKPDMSQLEAEIKAFWDAKKTEKEDQAERRAAYEKDIEHTLHDAANLAKNLKNEFAKEAAPFDFEFQVKEGEAPEEIRYLETILVRLRERRSTTEPARFEGLTKRYANAHVTQDRLEKAKEIVTREGLNVCPFCGAGIAIDNLEKKIDEAKTEMRAIQKEKQAIADIDKTLNDTINEIDSALKQYEQAVANLEAFDRGVTK